VKALQAEGVATVVTFLRAYNAGRLDEALAAFTDDPTYGDCDYATARPRVVGGRAELAALLRDRFADHDRVEVDHLTLNGPVIGVSFARRSSDTLSGIGRTGGVEEVPAAKVILDVFDPGARRNQGTAVRISAFNWAPVGGDPAPCDPGRG
jgi:hypothetical protein